MKKIFNILLAASVSALALTSCQEKTITVFHPADMVAPEITEDIEASYDIKENGAFLTLKVSEASYGIATSIRYTAYADVKDDFSSKQTLSSVTDTSSVVSISIDANTINNALMTLDCPFDEYSTIYLRVEAEMMSESNPVESMDVLTTGSVSTSVAAFIPQSLVENDMWGAIGDFTESRNWKLYSYLSEFPPESGLYSSPVMTFKEGDEFILRYNHSKDTLIGGIGNAGDTKLKLGVPMSINNGADAVNFGIDADQAGSQVIVLDSTSMQVFFLKWGVIGQVAGDGWSNDAPMIYDEAAGTWTATDLQFAASGQFKIRLKKAWDDDRGLDDGVEFAVNTPMKVKKGGGNITVKEAGYYEVVYNEKDETITVTKLRDLEKEE